MRSLFIVAIAAGLAIGCMSPTSTNSSSQLTQTTGGTTSGSGGSTGTTSSGSGGSGPPPPQPNGAGLISGFDPGNSIVRGYAYDPNNPSVSYMVEFWLDQPRPTGTALGQTLADVNRFLFPTGLHGFNFTVPMAYQDGRIRQIYAYQIDAAGNRNQLGGSPMGFWAGVNLTGKAYFDSTVAPAINAGGSCLSCHQLGGSGSADYNYSKALMASPNKFQGGTATSNELINRGVGINHGGGNRCGNVNSGICNLFQTWWAREFN